MKIYSFKEKLPELGYNIVVISESTRSTLHKIGIRKFDMETRKSILSRTQEYNAQEYFSDDPDDDGEYDITRADYWFYPSSIKLPKKAQQAKE